MNPKEKAALEAKEKAAAEAKERERLAGLRPPEQHGNTEVAKATGTAVGAALDFAADAGAGLEGADKDSFAIPFLLVLQPLSPQVVDETVQGAKAGQLMNSVTNELFTEGCFIPCAFQRRWIRWVAREAGGGFKGEMNTAEAAEERSKGLVKELEGRLYYPEQDGSINPKKCDRLADTRSHFGLFLPKPDSDIAIPIIIALSSSGVKRSKNFMSRIEGIKLRRADSTLFTPPSYSHMYSVKVTKETNEKGTWFLPEFGMVGPLSNNALYAQAKAFHDQVVSGVAQAAHETMNKSEAKVDDGKF